MKHIKTKFEKKNTNVEYRIFLKVDDGSKKGYPMELTSVFKEYDDALKAIEELINNGWRDTKILDSHIIKRTSEIIINDEIKAMMSAKKYNL